MLHFFNVCDSPCCVVCICGIVCIAARTFLCLCSTLTPSHSLSLVIINNSHMSFVFTLGGVSCCELLSSVQARTDVIIRCVAAMD